MGKTGVKSSPMCLVLCYGTITKGKLTVGKVGYKLQQCGQILGRVDRLDAGGSWIHHRIAGLGF